MRISREYIFQKIKFLIPVICIFYIIYSGFIYSIVYTSAKKLFQIEGKELMRIKLFGSSILEDGNTVSASFSIIDTNGNEMAVIERSWNGNYLTIDFYKTDLTKKTFYFPSAIYGKEQILGSPRRTKATSLSRYYDENNQCLLLGFGSTRRQRQALYNISSFSNGRYKVLKIGKVRKIGVDLSFCKTGIWYSIKIGKDGSLKLEEL